MKISNIIEKYQIIFCGILITMSQLSCEKSTMQESYRQSLKMNQIQVLGSHNSYKKAIEPQLIQLLLKEDSSILSLDYRHVSLQEQLNLGLRKLELDIVHDPEGGRFANPLGLQFVIENGGKPKTYDSLGKMQRPGFKVLHVQDIDFRSHCFCLIDCLSEIKLWSESHPGHLPIAVSFNVKTDNIDRPGFTELLPFTKSVFDSLDKVIISTIGRDNIIMPDDIRGDFSTLEEAVLKYNWPELNDVRGKFLFVLDEDSIKQAPYLNGHPSLKGRVMFVNATPGKDEAAFVIMNNPIRQQDAIKDMVSKGYIVRTRADAGTWEARENDYNRFNAALSSGAQFISTDYYIVDERLGNEFLIKMPNGVTARCNPINGNNCDKNSLSILQ